LRIKKNRGKRIVVILDNFSSHRSFETKKAAEDLGIVLIFLPPYPPDLNPIEFIWKSIKKELSSIFLTCKEEVKRVRDGWRNS
jgi:putative transposase